MTDVVAAPPPAVPFAGPLTVSPKPSTVVAPGGALDVVYVLSLVQVAFLLLAGWASNCSWAVIPRTSWCRWSRSCCCWSSRRRPCAAGGGR